MGKEVGPDGVCTYQGAWWHFALPQVILSTYAAFFVAMCAWAVTRTADAWLVVPAGVVCGWLLWTLFEYAFHRWLLHHVKRTLLRRIFWDAMHREHHGYRRMHDPSHRGIHLAISLPVIAGVELTTAWSSRGGFALATAAGWLLGYCTYEALHWVFHSGDPNENAIRPLRRLWQAHAVHHLERADRNYGFVTQFWDRRFATAAAGDQIKARAASISDTRPIR